MWQEDKDEDVSSNWMTLRKRKDTGDWKTTLCGEVALGEAMDLS